MTLTTLVRRAPRLHRAGFTPFVPEAPALLPVWQALENLVTAEPGPWEVVTDGRRVWAVEEAAEGRFRAVELGPGGWTEVPAPPDALAAAYDAAADAVRRPLVVGGRTVLVLRHPGFARRLAELGARAA